MFDWQDEERVVGIAGCFWPRDKAFLLSYSIFALIWIGIPV